MKIKFFLIISIILCLFLFSCATRTIAYILMDDYVIIKSSEYCERIAKAVVKLKKTFPGLNSLNDNGVHADSYHEIVIGPTNRKTSMDLSDELGPMDYVIRFENPDIFIIGGSGISTSLAVDKFIELLSHDDSLLEHAEFEYKYLFWENYNINPLCEDNHSFVPVWKSNGYDSPSWVGDFHEKIYVAYHDDCRVLTYAHRGDMVYYPENSLEGFLSAYLAGVDVIETDVRMTKDGIPVLMHDETLTRTTDAEKYIAKEGFPSSSYIKDWTYEQLQTLNLEHNGAATSYKIPTVYEALQLLGNKVFFILEDKTDLKFDSKYDLYPYAVATGSYGSLLFELGGRSSLKVWTSLRNCPAGLSELSGFIEECSMQGNDHLPSLTVFWNDPDCRSWPIMSMNENSDLWMKYVNYGARYIGTNQIVAMNMYLSSFMEKAVRK